MVRAPFLGEVGQAGQPEDLWGQRGEGRVFPTGGMAWTRSRRLASSQTGRRARQSRLVAGCWCLTESDAEHRCSLEVFAVVPWSLQPAVTSGSPVIAQRTHTLTIEEKKMKI